MMKFRYILFILVLLLCSNTVLAETKTDVSKAKEKIVVYYFHGNMRCVTCKKMEKYSREAVESAFSSDLKSGNIEFKAVNVEKGDNIHFIRDYKLMTRCVVLSKVVDGIEEKWVRLDKVWDYVRDEKKFKLYIEENIDSLKKGAV